MPKASKNDALLRQWEMLQGLPTYGSGISASDLTAYLADRGYEVSKRTVERDLVNLQGIFPIEPNDKGTPQGWRWIQGKSPNLPALTMADAVSLQIIEDLLKPLLPASLLQTLSTRFNQAKNILQQQVENNKNARWADKVRYINPALPLLPPTIADGVLETVQNALLHEKQLEVSYQSFSKTEPQAMTLHPLGLVQQGAVAYLIATAFDYKDARIYAIHRIHQATIRDEKSLTPKDFNLDDFINRGELQQSNGKQIKLLACVSEALAKILTETPLSGDQTLEYEEEWESYKLQATVLDSMQLRYWVLS